jgi:hypothetical protein
LRAGDADRAELSEAPAAGTGALDRGRVGHSRFFWGLRLHLLCTLHGLPVGFALAGAKADERQTLLGIFEADPELPAWRTGQVVITDKNYYGREFEAELAAADLDLLRPARKGEKPRPGTRFFKPLRQVIESVNDTFKVNSTSNSTVGTPPQGCGFVSCNASLP